MLALPLIAVSSWRRELSSMHREMRDRRRDQCDYALRPILARALAGIAMRRQRAHMSAHRRAITKNGGV